MSIPTYQWKLVTFINPIVREDKQTTKVRIVYDVPGKSTGPALNDCPHAGPSLLSDISNVLMRFRYHRVALAAHPRS